MWGGCPRPPLLKLVLWLILNSRTKFKIKFKGGGRGRPPHTFLRDYQRRFLRQIALPSEPVFHCIF